MRVLDFTRVLSGPHAGRMLCDMGADVIKVEPPTGDLTRFTSPRVNGIASYFAQQNAGKRNISLDLTKPAAVQLLLDLSAHVDVILENFRPGVMARMGLGYDAVAAVNPRIVYASISGFGATGLWSGRRAYASVVGAESGFTKAQVDAHPGQHYANDPHSHADVYTGIECASAVLAALFQRERDGIGQCIDISMAQTMLYVNEHVHNHLWDRPVADGVIRSFQPGDYPVVTTADGTQVVISGHPAENGTFDRFVAILDQPHLLTDPRFATVGDRLRHFDELVALVRAWAATVLTADALQAALSPYELAAGKLRSVREFADTAWAAEQGAIVDVSDRAGGTMRIPNAPWRFGAGSTDGGGLPKYRGEDNVEVLTDLLDLTPEAVAELAAQHILSSRVPPGAP